MIIKIKYIKNYWTTMDRETRRFKFPVERTVESFARFFKSAEIEHNQNMFNNPTYKNMFETFENELRKTFNHPVNVGNEGVVDSYDIFGLFSGTIVEHRVNMLAHAEKWVPSDENGNDMGYGMHLFQFRHFGELLHFIVPYYFGGIRPDLDASNQQTAFAINELKNNGDLNQVHDLMFQDVKTKLLESRIFLNYQEACTLMNCASKYWDLDLVFYPNK